MKPQQISQEIQARVASLEADILKVERRVAKFNPCHSPSDGKFCSGPGSGGGGKTPTKHAESATLRAYAREDRAHRTGSTRDFQAAIDAHRQAREAHLSAREYLQEEKPTGLKGLFTGRKSRGQIRVHTRFISHHEEAAQQLAHLGSIHT